MKEIKGEWRIIHGVLTPGGDPCWVCSNCGKDEHVCGIETPYTQHFICKNCGSHNDYNHRS